MAKDKDKIRYLQKENEIYVANIEDLNVKLKEGANTIEWLTTESETKDRILREFIQKIESM